MLKNKKNKNKKKNVRPKNRRAKNTTKYMYSTALQGMGVGKARVRVTRFLLLTVETEGSKNNAVYNVLQEAFSSQEFNRFAQDYTYCKLDRVSVTMLPVTSTSGLPEFLKMDWLSGNAEDISFDDNAKIIWVNTQVPRTYFFKAPNILINGFGDNPNKVNYHEWQNSKEIVAEQMPGYIKFTTYIPIRLVIEVAFIFRGYNAVYPYTQKEVTIAAKEVGKEEEEIKDKKKLRNQKNH